MIQGEGVTALTSGSQVLYSTPRRIQLERTLLELQFFPIGIGITYSKNMMTLRL